MRGEPTPKLPPCPPCGACGRPIWFAPWRRARAARLSRWDQHVATVRLHPRCARALAGLAARTATPGADRVAGLLAAVVAAGGWRVRPLDGQSAGPAAGLSAGQAAPGEGLRGVAS